jgi:hypothetical protein
MIASQGRLAAFIEGANSSALPARKIYLNLIASRQFAVANQFSIALLVARSGEYRWIPATRSV